MTTGRMPFSRDRLRMIVFNTFNPAWPDGLRVYVQHEENIATTLAQELLQAFHEGPNAIEQLTLINKPRSRAALAELAGHHDNGELRAAIKSMLGNGALLYAPTGDGLLGPNRQQLTGYMVTLNRDV